MPLLVGRFGRALIRTISLLFHPGMLRRLPWAYIRALIRRQRQTKIAAAGIVITVPLTLVGIVVPALLGFSLMIGLACLFAAWVAGLWASRRST